MQVHEGSQVMVVHGAFKSERTLRTGREPLGNPFRMCGTQLVGCVLSKSVSSMRTSPLIIQEESCPDHPIL
jgi:hypothetical protein